MIHPKTQIHLYLIRHAESDVNTKPELVGGQSPNAKLTDLGQGQALHLRKWLYCQKIAFTTVYSSPFVRTIETAKLALGIEDHKSFIMLDDRLVEYSAGEWEGKPRTEVQTSNVLHQMAEMVADFQPEKGESQRQVSLRAANWLQEAVLGDQNLLQTGENIHLAVFSHGLTIKCLLHHILGFDSHLIWRMVIDNCSVSKLIFNSRGWWPVYTNRVPY